MKAKELFDEFLDFCKDYEIVFNNIVMTNGENMLTVFNPGDSNVDYLYYEARFGKSRMSGVSSDIDKLTRLTKETVGSEKLKQRDKRYYI